MKKAVIVGATGNLGSDLASLLMDQGFWVDNSWFESDRPDVTKYDSFDSLPEELDLAVYCVGVNYVAPFSEVSNESWDYVINVNLNSAFRFAKSVSRALAPRSGCLVFVSSIMSSHPYPNRAVYAASKSGLEGLTRSIAVENGMKFSTICIRLGHIDSLMKTTTPNPDLLPKVREFTPDHKLTSVSEVSQLIIDLSRHSKILNGSIIHADRGYSINRWPL